MKKVLIVGAGRFGSTTANRLSELGAEVTSVDTNQKKLVNLKSMVSKTLVLNAIDMDAIKEEIESNDYNAGVVAIGENFSTVLLVSLYMIRFGIKYVVARASNPNEAKILRKIGVDLVITPEDEMGQSLAERLILAESEQIDLSPDTSVVRVLAPPKFIGKNIGELELASKGIYFLFIARRYTEQGFVKMVFPDELDFKITEGDYLLFAGDTRRIASFMESAD